MQLCLEDKKVKLNVASTYKDENDIDMNGGEQCIEVQWR